MGELKKLQQELMQFAWQINGKQSNIAFDRVPEPDKKELPKAAVPEEFNYFRYENPQTNRAFQGLTEPEKTRSRKYGLKFS